MPCEVLSFRTPTPSGGEALELIGQLAGFVSTSIANKENLQSLADRAGQLMDVLVGGRGM